MASSSITLLLIFGTCLLFDVAVASGKQKKTWEEDDKVEVPELPDFNYEEIDKWGSLQQSYAACSSGKRQSPIDINTYEIVLNETLKSLDRDYHVDSATLSTEGTQIEMFFGGDSNGRLKIDGKKYNLAQLHIHTPSEHRLNGVQYAAEMHQVHKADDGSRAVVAVLFKEDIEPSPFIKMMMPQLKELAQHPCKGHQHSSPIKKFKASYLRKWPRNYYRYHGSLTTPPCDENVVWSVLEEVKTISKEQIQALKAPLCDENKNNARPPQALNYRKIQKYDKN